MKRSVGWCLILAVLMTSCANDSAFVEVADDPNYLHRSMKRLTDVIVHDIFSPPQASRIYAYPSIAAYEIMALQEDDLRSLAGQVHGLDSIPKPEADQSYSMAIASVHAFLQTGKALIFSESKIEEFGQELLVEMKAEGVPKSVYHRSLAYGKLVSDHVLAWAAEDNYKQTRTFPKYSITDDPGKWQPTPPDYMDGIEPHWNRIRTFVLDSAQQFVPKPPTEFSTDEKSQFYREAMEVYNVIETGPEDAREIAQFWDCNPYVSHHRGHVMFATKKITPGGHWIGITAQVSRETKLDLTKSSEIYARVSIALADAFISCWDEKYRSNLVRPETYINQLIDSEWLPILQTPPFPEHTSGHSVISSAAGEVLTAYFGDNYAFNDSVELEYGLPVRSFGSFREAYAEAAISRLYGGIHYMPAISYGVEQGQEVGSLILERLETSGD